MDVIRPDWPAPPRVRALVTTRAFGDVSEEETRKKLRSLVPIEPSWLQQVHGTDVVEASRAARPRADASFSRQKDAVCVVMAADCMPVLLADAAGTVVGAAHAGWRGLCAGVIEATVGAMRVPPATLLAWLGPAIGPRVYEVGPEVRDAFLARDARAEVAFVANRPGHWLLDLYAVARQRLGGLGISRVYGGDFCTYTEKERFFSFRRERSSARMAAVVWLT